MPLETFGCQMNKADSARLMEQFRIKGYDQVEDKDNADILIYNTCSVREHAEQKALSHIGRLKFLKAKKPDIRICVIGCMAQRKKEEIKNDFKQVDYVIGPSTMLRLPKLLENDCTGVFPDTEETLKEFYEYYPDYVSRSKDFSRYIPVMKGCSNYCSYCIVPYVRGNEQYRKKEDIIDECSKLADAGITEIMLLGQSVNSHPQFMDILYSLSQISHIERIRFVTSYPGKMDESLVDMIASTPVLCNYFHIPVQSGSDKILQKMNRKYSISRYIEIADYIRKRIPRAAISSDFIVGFPSETEEDFNKTFELIERLEFDQCFTFKYSPRPGTEAAKWEDDVPINSKKEHLPRRLSCKILFFRCSRFLI
ncbi:tRNA (N6-isopentenyl adenosine(37)-C2)-methylthiotransferase MiaB [Elusimicrobiota bacterium]